MVDASEPSEMRLVTRLYRTTNAIVRELDQRLSREHDVTFIQALTLLAIDSFERPQPHLVADYLSQQSQTVTGVLDRLERAGHVTRRRDLDDRRAVRLELTDRGAELVGKVRHSLEGHIGDVVGGVTARSRDRLSDDLEMLEQSSRLQRSGTNNSHS
jgi:DNA-binding MarR family transcriptional regulator